MDDKIIPGDEDASSDIDNERTEEAPSTVFEKLDELPSVENNPVANIFKLFASESQIRLSSFLRKKIIIKFKSINYCLFDEIDHDYTTSLMLNFQMSPHNKHGLITFDFIFLHSVINLLYGGATTSNETIMRQPGKSGLKIAVKVAEIFLDVLQESMIEHLKINLKILKLSSQLGSFFMKGNSEKCFNVSFSVLFDPIVCNLTLVIPEELIESELLRENLHQSAIIEGKKEQDMVSSPPVFDDKARKELIDSHITISANLANVTLKLRDVVNMKPGDIIPIDDPTLVYITLNKKNIFKASAGQSNQRRAVKILDKI
jgi:flagellar motor switch protein FliM